jgi:hypothetical protein
VPDIVPKALNSVVWIYMTLEEVFVDAGLLSNGCLPRSILVEVQLIVTMKADVS